MSRKKESSFSAGIILTTGAAVVVIIFIFLGLGGKDRTTLNQKETVESLNDVHGLAVDLEDPNRPYIASHTGLYTVEDGQLYRVGSTQNDLMGFSTHPTEAGTFFASGHPKTGGNLGFQISKDGGESWQKVSDGLNGPVDFHALAVSEANPQIIYGWYRNSLQKSTDGGQKWQAVNTDLSGVFSFVSDPKDEQALYAVTSSGVVVSRDGGNQWSSLSNQQLISLAIDPSNNQNLVASSANGILKSSDGGKSWSEVAGSPGSILYLAYAKSSPATVFAVDGNGLVYKSTDSGLTWAKVN